MPPYKVILTYDGITRTYWCEHHYDTVVLFDALYRGTPWNHLQVIETNTDRVIQETQS